MMIRMYAGLTEISHKFRLYLCASEIRMNASLTEISQASVSLMSGRL